MSSFCAARHLDPFAPRHRPTKDDSNRPSPRRKAETTKKKETGCNRRNPRLLPRAQRSPREREKFVRCTAERPAGRNFGKATAGRRPRPWAAARALRPGGAAPTRQQRTRPHRRRRVDPAGHEAEAAHGLRHPEHGGVGRGQRPHVERGAPGRALAAPAARADVRQRKGPAAASARSGGAVAATPRGSSEDATPRLPRGSSERRRGRAARIVRGRDAAAAAGCHAAAGRHTDSLRGRVAAPPRPCRAESLRGRVAAAIARGPSIARRTASGPCARRPRRRAGRPPRASFP